MSFLATTMIALILEFAPPGPGYVVYPVSDIVQDPPRFNDSPALVFKIKIIIEAGMVDLVRELMKRGKRHEVFLKMKKKWLK